MTIKWLKENNKLIDLFYQAEDFFFQSISRECLDFDGKVKAYLTGINFEYFNPLILRENIANIESVLNKCSAICQQSNLPWIVVIPEHFIENNIEKTLNNKNFKVSDQQALAIFYELKAENKMQNSNVLQDIRPTDKDLNNWIIPLKEAFESTFEISNQYKQAHERALRHKANFHHFTLYKHNGPISSLTLSIKDNIARIDDVGTLPSHQKMGYATHLINHALKEARNLGAEYCFLEASESGLSVYQKIGFQALFKNKIYIYDKRIG